jgi:hypothetical protein
LAVTAAAALALLLLLRTIQAPGPGENPPERVRAPRPGRDAGEPPAATAAALRNVFEYADASVAPPPPPTGTTTAVAPPPGPVVAVPEPSPSPLVRLVGLIHRGGRTKAALAVAGSTIVLAVGESASGYTVVGIDEDEGVRVRTPEGSTIVLAATSGQ